MVIFFLHYMKQTNGQYICVQLLQTLNILFENIRNETSLCNRLIFYLLFNYSLSNFSFKKIIFYQTTILIISLYINSILQTKKLWHIIYHF